MTQFLTLAAAAVSLVAVAVVLLGFARVAHRPHGHKHTPSPRHDKF